MTKNNEQIINRKNQIAVIMQELNYIVDFSEEEMEFYDNLMALLEALRYLEIIDNESYDNAELKLAKLWGFNTNE